ncbi:MAG TPA: efflux RND transporter periplasmic adaptor subunit [Gemmatimonadota bacterium]|nr:efflux RND transporter periplasmic adaptor subunit [Gemmatimonadota bacterium]
MAFQWKTHKAKFRSTLLIAIVLGTAGLLTLWKIAATQAEQAAAANQPEPVEVVTAAMAKERQHRSTTTAIGTVVATRSVTLRNEVPGTVRTARLIPGQVVEPGTVLVALDVAVELAELRAQQARAELAAATLARYERMIESRAVSEIELDDARAERDVAAAEVARIRAIIERKTIRAPFRARVGIADVHPGQFLDTGTLLTTLQGVDEAVQVDFPVPQSVAAQLAAEDLVDVMSGPEESVIPARILATDARVDPATRNATVRVRIDEGGDALTPGASVRVRIPVGETRQAVAVPVSALRRGPSGDHVFVLEPTNDDRLRAHERQVQIGAVLEDEVVLLNGLEPGERVATSGSFKLREGALVSVAKDAPAAISQAGR